MRLPCGASLNFMSIFRTLLRSKDDLEKPDRKTYWGYTFGVKLIKASDILEKKALSPTEKRTLLFDLSEKEPVDEIIILDNVNKGLGKITSFQMREILDDIGFNLDPWLWGKHQADIEAVMSITEFSIPSWVKVVRFVAKYLPSYEKAVATKISPAKDRLHLSLFENNDGSWIVVAHTEPNWLSLNLRRVFKAHVGHGAGDYVTGTIMAYGLFKGFSKCLEKDSLFTVKKINQVLARAYDKSLSVKLRRVINRPV